MPRLTIIAALIAWVSATAFSPARDESTTRPLGFETVGGRFFISDSSKIDNPDKVRRAFERAEEDPHGEVNLIIGGGRVLNADFVPSEKTESKIKRVLVQFREPPIKTVRASDILTKTDILRKKTSLEDLHTTFEKDLRNIEIEKLFGGDSKFRSSIRVKRHFYVAINGADLFVDDELITEIENLDYVKRVTEAKIVYAVDDESNAVIGAPEVWSLGATGDGILISIIDTGIDEDHIELAGKVVGGWDFVNEDDDPADGHGHGTHCAGIAAANGPTLTGVAPDAELLAVKVLNDGGSGYDNDIIAGIEYSLDPDGNPATDDGADVLSLSLGGPGDPDDPMSQAVDAAPDNGAVVCIAAGNSGSSSYTIGSPGCARKPITVGASDKSDNLAYFSSRGPSNEIHGIKPEILAPGVAINSSTPGDNYASWNGTSMATPHIAGAAALLLERFPGSTPDQIKARLMNSTVDLGYNVWEQGAGRADLSAAAELNTLAIPAKINFGVDDLALATWTSTASVTISNESVSFRDYTISVEDAFPSGVDFTVTPSSFSLGAGESQEITVELEVDNTSVPFPTGNPPTYDGFIYVESGDETVGIPTAFIKSCIIDFVFDEAPYSVLIHSNGGIYYQMYRPSENQQFMVQSGTYDVLVQFSGGQHYWIAEGITVSDRLELIVNKTDCVHNVTFDAKDELGNSMYFYRSVTQWSNRETKWGSWMTGSGYNSINFNEMSSEYTFDQTVKCIDSWRGPEYYTIYFGVGDGISSDLSYANDPENYKKLDYTFLTEPDVEQIFFTVGHSQGFGITSTNYSPDLDSPYRKLPPFEQTIYLDKIPYDDYSVPYIKVTAYNTTGDTYPISSSELYRSAFFVNETDGVLRGYIYDFNVPVYESSASEIPMRQGGFAPFFSGIFSNYSSSLAMSGDYTCGYRYFVSQYGDVSVHETASVEFYEDETSLLSGTLENDGYSYYRDYFYPGSSVNKAVVNYGDYEIDGTAGDVTVTARFDLSLSDRNPPIIKSFGIKSESFLADEFSSADGGEFYFSLRDDDNLDYSSVSYAYKPNSGDTWSEISTARSDNRFSGDFPSDLAPGLYDVKLFAADESGNSIEQIHRPAFKATFAAPVLVSPTNETTDVSLPTTLEWDPVPGADSYRLLISTSAGFDVDLFEVFVVGTSHESIDIDFGETYYWKAFAMVGGESGPESETWSFTTGDEPVDGDETNCTGDLDLPGSIVPPGIARFYAAEGALNVGGSGRSFVARGGELGAEVEMMASTRVKFMPGFKAEQGSNVKAFIVQDPCAEYTARSGRTAKPLREVSSVTHENKEPELNVYPNPSSGVLTIDIGKRRFIDEIKIFDSLGEIVWQISSVQNDKIQVDISSRPIGAYNIEIRFEDRIINKQALIVK